MIENIDYLNPRDLQFIGKIILAVVKPITKSDYPIENYPETFILTSATSGLVFTPLTDDQLDEAFPDDSDWEDRDISIKKIKHYLGNPTDPYNIEELIGNSYDEILDKLGYFTLHDFVNIREVCMLQLADAMYNMFIRIDREDEIRLESVNRKIEELAGEYQAWDPYEPLCASALSSLPYEFIDDADEMLVNLQRVRTEDMEARAREIGKIISYQQSSGSASASRYSIDQLNNMRFPDYQNLLISFSAKIDDLIKHTGIETEALEDISSEMSKLVDDIIKEGELVTSDIPVVEKTNLDKKIEKKLTKKTTRPASRFDTLMQASSKNIENLRKKIKKGPNLGSSSLYKKVPEKMELEKKDRKTYREYLISIPSEIIAVDAETVLDYMKEVNERFGVNLQTKKQLDTPEVRLKIVNAIKKRAVDAWDKLAKPTDSTDSKTHLYILKAYVGLHDTSKEGSGWNVDSDQLLKGLNVELEHSDITRGDPVLTAKIALAHLKEMPDYYSRLERMEGSGIYRDLANAYRAKYCGTASRPLYEGEIHPLCANFEGPGTQIQLENVRMMKPYNNIDACAKEHDLAYNKAFHMTDRRAREKAVRFADEEVLKCFDKYKNEEPYYSIGKAGIKSKMLLENYASPIAKSVTGSYYGKY